VDVAGAAAAGRGKGMMKSEKQTSPGLPLSGEEARFPPDETTSHSTKLSKNDSQVAGYDKGGENRAWINGVPDTKASSCSSPDKGRSGGVKGFIPYNKKLTALARENRKNPTAAESKMWNEVLRMRHFSDYKFLRQKPIADFIVDFYSVELRLVIEIDGDSHAEAVEYDAARNAALNALGISIVRYTNDEVLNNLEGVYDDLVGRVEHICDLEAGI
jgi:very-short-patch-repair endonuclease